MKASCDTTGELDAYGFNVSEPVTMAYDVTDPDAVVIYGSLYWWCPGRYLRWRHRSYYYNYSGLAT